MTPIRKYIAARKEAARIKREEQARERAEAAAFLAARQAEAENERLERIVKQSIANERLKAYRRLLQWCEGAERGQS